MKMVVRNLKGEVVGEVSYDDPWWKLSASTWILIGGLVLFNIGCFFGPALINRIFHLLDVRLWPWWVYIPVVVFILFSIQWIRIALHRNDYDPDERKSAKCFLRMSIAISALGGIVIILNWANLLRLTILPIQEWLAYGRYSFAAILIYGVILGSLIAVLYLIKEWIKSL